MAASQWLSETIIVLEPHAFRRKMGGAEDGMLTVKVEPRTGRAVDAHDATMQPGELLDERQADAGPFVGARTRAFDAMKALEQPRQLVRRDAPTPVSRTRSSTWSPSARKATATMLPPSKVNLKALDSRLSTTFSHMSRST